MTTKTLASLALGAAFAQDATGTDAVLCAHLRHPPQGPATGTAAVWGGAASSSGWEAE